MTPTTFPAVFQVGVERLPDNLVIGRSGERNTDTRPDREALGMPRTDLGIEGPQLGEVHGEGMGDSPRGRYPGHSHFDECADGNGAGTGKPVLFRTLAIMAAAINWGTYSCVSLGSVPYARSFQKSFVSCLSMAFSTLCSPAL